MASSRKRQKPLASRIWRGVRQARLRRHQPGLALEAGLAALHWLVEGYGYEVTGLDVSSAFTHTMRAAARLDRSAETRDRVRALVAREPGPQRFVTEILGREIGLR